MTAMNLHRYPSPSNGVALGKMGCTDLFHRITAKDYVQDGLIAMWDGIENAGWGVHDANAMTWKDIVGENDATLRSALSESRYWGNNYFYNSLESAMFIGTPTSALKTTFTTGDFTIQGIFIPEIQPSSGNFCIFQCSPSGTTTDGCIFSVTNRTTCGSANKMTWAGTRAVINFSSAIQSWDQILGTVFDPTFIFDSVNGTQEMKMWEMSSTITTTAAIPTASDLTSFAIGCYNWSTGRNRNVRGKLYNLRIYSRKLTAQEIAANYAIDKARFGLP